MNRDLVHNLIQVQADLKRERDALQLRFSQMLVGVPPVSFTVDLLTPEERNHWRVRLKDTFQGELRPGAQRWRFQVTDGKVLLKVLDTCYYGSDTYQVVTYKEVTLEHMHAAGIPYDKFEAAFLEAVKAAIAECQAQREAVARLQALVPRTERSILLMQGADQNSDQNSTPNPS